MSEGNAALEPRIAAARAALSAARSEWRAVEAAARRVSKAVADLEAALGGDPARAAFALKAGVAALRKAGAALPPALPDVGSRAAEVDALARAAGQALLARLKGDLRAGLAGLGAPPEIAGTEVRFAPYRLALDLERGRAALYYGDDPLDEDVPLDPEKIAARARGAKEDLARGGTAPEKFLPELYRGYAAAARRAGRRAPGDPANVVEVLREVCLGRQTKAFGRDPRRAAFREYPRAQFMWDLGRLFESREPGARELAPDPAEGRDGRVRLELLPAANPEAQDRGRSLLVPGASHELVAAVRFVPA